MKQIGGVLLLFFSVSSLFATEHDPQRPTEKVRVAVYGDVGVGRSIKELLSVLEKADGLGPFVHRAIEYVAEMPD